MSNSYSASDLTTSLTSVGGAALPFLGAGIAGMIGLAGAKLGINAAWGLFRKGTR